MFSKDIDLNENIVLKNRIPVLVNNQDWLKLFGEVENRNIKNFKQELEGFVEEKAELEKKMSRLKKEKIDIMKRIICTSNKVNNEDKIESVDLLDEYRNNIYVINDNIDEITYRLETIPQNIRETNFELLKATIKYGYKELKQRQKKLEITEEEIYKLKNKLKDLINEKYDYEEWINGTYSFLHGMLGNIEMEKLDDEILG